ncbi:MAG: S41 family peptidase [Oscillospiraceae bacterium]|nr:S41 family peptidase [Oscillospiraceae bacterium]
MKKKILLLVSHVLVAAVAALTGVLCCWSAMRADQTKLEELWAIVDERFIGEADPDLVANAMVEALGDQWSHYMTAEQYSAYRDTMSNSYVGVGMTVQARSDGQGLDVLAVTAGGGAEEAGILAGDQIVAVDGSSIVDMDVNDATARVRGEEGTTVELTVVRQEQTLTFRVERRRIETIVASAQMLEGGVALITIENFDDRCAQETIACIQQMLDQGAKALIFDVRGNPGGYKRELVELLDYLLPEGPLFRTEDYQGNVTVDESDADHLDIPMAVLMDLQSYSAAEFFAAALDEYDAAITVGEKTYGKGYLQNTFQLSDGSAVTLSVGKYFTPNGVSLAGVGLEPDVPVEVDDATAAAIAAGTLDPMEDPQVLAALEALGYGVAG